MKITVSPRIALIATVTSMVGCRTTLSPVVSRIVTIDVGGRGPQGLTGATGDAGSQGPPGDAGPQGIPGVQGIQGETGPQGAIGATGPQGDTGATGSAGATGPQGDQGDPGTPAVYSDATPQALGTATPGADDSAARGGHVHPMPSASDVGAYPVASASSVSVLCNPSASVGSLTLVRAAGDNGVFRRVAGALDFGNVVDGMIPAREIGLTKLSKAGEFTLTAEATPTTPSSGDALLYASTALGRNSLATLGADGVERQLMHHLAFSRVSFWSAAGGTTNLATSGVGTPPLNANDASVAKSRTVATTTNMTRAKRLGFEGVAAVARSAGFRHALNYVSASDGAGVGGFLFTVTFGASDAAAVATARMWVGLQNGQSVGNFDPATITQLIMLGHGNGDANMKLYYGGSSAQTPIDLGANFPAQTRNTDWYELAIHAPLNVANTFYWRVRRLGTAYVASGTLTGAAAVVPQSTTLLGFNANRNSNATALAVAIDVGQIFMQTDF